MTTTERKTCRVCGHGELRHIYDFGNLPVSTFVEKPGDVPCRAPLKLVECAECCLVQLSHTAPQELMYSSHYWYRSSLNRVIADDLREIAREAEKLVELRTGDTVLDIGANDGTLLEAYPDFVEKVGCEPAKNLHAELGTRCDEVIPDFWKAELFRDRKAKIVTAIGMFYDMEDPNQFIRDVELVLASDGVFVAQLMTMRQMLEKNDVGNVCHEHIEYYSYASLVELYERNGLEIFRVEENRINGGSYRLFARKLRSGSIDHPELAPDWDGWIMRIEENRARTREAIGNFVRQGKRVYAYGASTKGNTILNWYRLDSLHISGAADKSPEKIGRFMVGSGVPIVSEEEGRKNADIFFVLPYAFLDSFIEREYDWLENGGQFLVSTPTFRLI